MSRDGGFQAVRAAGKNSQIRTVYSHFMLIFVFGPIRAADFYALFFCAAHASRAAPRARRRTSTYTVALQNSLSRNILV